MKPAKIIVLGIAIVSGGVAAFLINNQKAPTVTITAPAAQLETDEVLVASNDIDVGDTLAPGKMRWQVWPSEAASSASYIKRMSRPTAVDDLGGAVARKKFVAGEPILEDKVIKAGSSGYMAALLPPGIRAISIPITPETGAGGFILPNDHVDVLLTRAEKHATGETYTSETILPNVRVLAIDQTVEEKNGQRVVVGKIATLALSARDAEALALATRIGTLSLALRSMSDIKPTNPDVASARTSINIIRFGMAAGGVKQPQ